MNKNLIFTTIAIITAMTATAQAVPIDIQEALHPVIYPFTIDPKTANAKYNDLGTHMPLTEEYGFVIIPPSAYRQKEDHNGSLGIIVSHQPGDTYSACEVRCARCLYEYKQHNKMTPMESHVPNHVLGFFECKHCGAQLGSFVFMGTTSLDHYEYQDIHVLANEDYFVEQIKDEYGYLKELRITNNTYMIERLEHEEEERKRDKSRDKINILELHRSLMTRSPAEKFK